MGKGFNSKFCLNFAFEEQNSFPGANRLRDPLLILTINYRHETTFNLPNIPNQVNKT